MTTPTIAPPPKPNCIGSVSVASCPQSLHERQPGDLPLITYTLADKKNNSVDVAVG